jgi:hypothetical protein
MTAHAKRSPVFVRVRLGLWLRTVASVTFLLSVLLSGSAKAQSTDPNRAQADASSVRGKVLNRESHEPISRALVFSPDQQHAMLTDDQGRFEFKFPPQETAPNLTAVGDASGFRVSRIQMARNSRPTMFLARKPGFLDSTAYPFNGRVAANQSEVVIYLDPESLIIGHVKIPAMEGHLRVRLELYRREIREGQERWETAKTFTTWADGEFRFCDLAAGTYKLGTNEELDRDPLTFTPGGELFGYPPVFYPGAADFSSASVIQLAAGATFEAKLSPTRHEYYPVRIPIANGAGEQPLNLRVYPLGRPGPGYSLGYNSAEQLIQGMLPDGNYTLQANVYGQPGSTGFLNFSVGDGRREEPAINLVPNTSLTVAVKEEFQSPQSVFFEGTVERDGGLSNTANQRRVNLNVRLMPIEDFGSGEIESSQPSEGTQEHALVVPNVRPGRYRVHAQTGAGYVASILYGGSDLLHQPLVVGLGGSSAPIEITLRDDGAEVDGKVEDATQSSYIYFLPIGESAAQFRETASAPDGSFSAMQLPPGTYRVLAFDLPQNELPYNDTEAMRKLESEGQVIRLDASQKEHLRLKMISAADSQ